MGFLDWFRGQSADEPNERAGGREHERHVEQSEHPGSAPTVPPDHTDQTADEVEAARTESRGEEQLLEAKGRDDQELRDSRIPPRQS
ncbi:MAG: hypothetical protein ACR2L0_10545 [Gaiellaceae bacterium]